VIIIFYLSLSNGFVGANGFLDNDNVLFYMAVVAHATINSQGTHLFNFQFVAFLLVLTVLWNVGFINAIIYGGMFQCSLRDRSLSIISSTMDVGRAKSLSSDFSFDESIETVSIFATTFNMGEGDVPESLVCYFYAIYTH